MQGGQVDRDVNRLLPLVDPRHGQPAGGDTIGCDISRFLLAKILGGCIFYSQKRFYK